MFRTFRRAPWIALGAAGAYYLDGTKGPTRRRDALERIQSLTERVRHKFQTEIGTDIPDQLGSEASAPAYVSGEASVMEEASLATSWAGTNTPGEEHRRSEHTVAPADPGYSNV